MYMIKSTSHRSTKISAFNSRSEEASITVRSNKFQTLKSDTSEFYQNTTEILEKYFEEGFDGDVNGGSAGVIDKPGEHQITAQRTRKYSRTQKMRQWVQKIVGIEKPKNDPKQVQIGWMDEWLERYECANITSRKRG